ncbi:MAG: FHA domain-containing protein [Clostridiales Family XIII bacterium]|jgi:pSer/pThr/pTyr-binding forkhead associated (FHA) protein/ribosomal protein L37E|nr:FHA domain-containing protein [Clostridiales Family XIII bacterium]
MGINFSKSGAAVCVRCGKQNKAGMKFCVACGTPLPGAPPAAFAAAPATPANANWQPMPSGGAARVAGVSAAKTCPKCGKTYSTDRNFCVACGTPLAPAPEPMRQTMPPAQMMGAPSQPMRSASYADDETTLLDALGDGGFDDETTLLTPPEPEVVAFLVPRLSGNEIQIDKPVFTIGRKQNSSDYCVTGNAAVSRKHAEIVKDGDRYLIKDLKSKNRTFVNGTPIGSFETVELLNGYVIRVADVEFDFYIKGNDDGYVTDILQ